MCLTSAYNSARYKILACLIVLCTSAICPSCSRKPDTTPPQTAQTIRQWSGRWEADEFMGIQAVRISFIEENGGLVGYQDELTPNPGFRDRIYFHNIRVDEQDNEVLHFNWREATGTEYKLVMTSPSSATFYVLSGDKWEAGGGYGERCAILHKK